MSPEEAIELPQINQSAKQIFSTTNYHETPTIQKLPVLWRNTLLFKSTLSLLFIICISCVFFWPGSIPYILRKGFLTSPPLLRVNKDDVTVFQPPHLKSIISPEAISSLMQVLDEQSIENSPQYIALFGQLFDVTSQKELFLPLRDMLHNSIDLTRYFAMSSMVPQDTTHLPPIFDHNQQLQYLSVQDLSPRELKLAERWLTHFRLNYPFIGVLSGPYFEASGTPTPLLIRLKAILRRIHLIDHSTVPKSPNTFQKCEATWLERTGGVFWCKQQQHRTVLALYNQLEEAEAMFGGETSMHSSSNQKYSTFSTTQPTKTSQSNIDSSLDKQTNEFMEEDLAQKKQQDAENLRQSSSSSGSSSSTRQSKTYKRYTRGDLRATQQNVYENTNDFPETCENPEKKRTFQFDQPSSNINDLNDPDDEYYDNTDVNQNINELGSTQKTKRPQIRNEYVDQDELDVSYHTTSMPVVYPRRVHTARLDKQSVIYSFISDKKSLQGDNFLDSFIESTEQSLIWNEECLCLTAKQIVQLNTPKVHFHQHLTSYITAVISDIVKSIAPTALTKAHQQGLPSSSSFSHPSSNSQPLPRIIHQPPINIPPNASFKHSMSKSFENIKESVYDTKNSKNTNHNQNIQVLAPSTARSYQSSFASPYSLSPTTYIIKNTTKQSRSSLDIQSPQLRAQRAELYGVSPFTSYNHRLISSLTKHRKNVPPTGNEKYIQNQLSGPVPGYANRWTISDIVTVTPSEYITTHISHENELSTPSSYSVQNLHQHGYNSSSILSEYSSQPSISTLESSENVIKLDVFRTLQFKKELSPAGLMGYFATQASFNNAISPLATIGSTDSKPHCENVHLLESKTLAQRAFNAWEKYYIDGNVYLQYGIIKTMNDQSQLPSNTIDSNKKISDVEYFMQIEVYDECDPDSMVCAV